MFGFESWFSFSFVLGWAYLFAAYQREYDEHSESGLDPIPATAILSRAEERLLNASNEFGVGLIFYTSLKYLLLANCAEFSEQCIPLIRDNGEIVILGFIAMSIAIATILAKLLLGGMRLARNF